MRILIVEDEIASRRGLVDLLMSLGPPYKVAGVADNGAEGLNKLRNLTPHVAFVDIKMPVMDGLTMIREAYRQGMRTLFIVISAYAEFPYARKALRYGVLDYLVKPFTLVDIETVLKRAAAAMTDSILPEDIAIQHPIVVRTINVISAQYHQHINLGIISEKLHITPEYLSYLFKRDTGINFVTYLRNYRIEQAIRIMKRNERLKVCVIASAVGFSDAKYFCRVFRNVTGQSPSDYFRDYNDRKNDQE